MPLRPAMCGQRRSLLSTSLTRNCSCQRVSAPDKASLEVPAGTAGAGLSPPGLVWCTGARRSAAGGRPALQGSAQTGREMRGVTGLRHGRIPYRARGGLGLSAPIRKCLYHLFNSLKRGGAKRARDAASFAQRTNNVTMPQGRISVLTKQPVTAHHCPCPSAAVPCVPRPDRRHAEHRPAALCGGRETLPVPGG